MTPKQKKELKDIFGGLEALQERAQTLATEVKEAWDEKSEKWRESEAGMDAEKEADDLESFSDSLESAKESVWEHVSE